jgi:hypothetical protein
MVWRYRGLQLHKEGKLHIIELLDTVERGEVWVEAKKDLFYPSNVSVYSTIFPIRNMLLSIFCVFI